ncbi:acyl carrier protein [Fulvivirga sp. M361]|uniref:acyl carrier protein n=1 Tax=Fulvivirga sp. M361 TaxID=2594266 RepID=UPI0016297D19|nr:acyl carrier protein [Fulvivirga sp. M361]
MQKVTKEYLVEWIKKEISHETGIEVPLVDVHTELINFRIDSIQTGAILQKLEKVLNLELGILMFWDYPTIDKLTDYLIEEINKKS